MPDPLYHRWRVRRFERSELAARGVLDAHVDPARNAVDVGANRGILAAALARRSQHVWAYEPDPQMQALLRRYAPANVTCSAIALSDAEGTFDLVTPIWGEGASRTHGSLSKSFEGHDVVRTPVQTRPLDSMGHDNIGFLKIDVEGHELAVLRGAQETLRTQRPALWVEIERDHQPEGEMDLTFALLDEAGYRGFFIFEGERHPLASFDAERHQPLVDGVRPPGRSRVADFLFLPA